MVISVLQREGRHASVCLRPAVIGEDRAFRGRPEWLRAIVRLASRTPLNVRFRATRRVGTDDGFRVHPTQR